MAIRNAKIKDSKAIHALISTYAERDRMLFRSLAEIYENIQSFFVFEEAGKVVGCCALSVIWSDLAEVKSLAVDTSCSGKGIGKSLVNACVERADQLGVEKVFALTLEPQFFDKVGFSRIDKKELPMKVWSDCAHCPKQDHCDETAMILIKC